MPKSSRQIEAALRASGGFVTEAARQLGISHQAVSDRIKHNPRLQKIQNEIKESYLDLAESKLVEKVREKDLGALCFYLKCQGKRRGYIERSELTGADGEPLLNMRIEFVKDEKPKGTIPG